MHEGSMRCVFLVGGIIVCDFSARSPVHDCQLVINNYINQYNRHVQTNYTKYFMNIWANSNFLYNQTINVENIAILPIVILFLVLYSICPKSQFIRYLNNIYYILSAI
jgi:hypothetical protein